MEDFQDALEDCRLHDLGFKGPKYTWNNGRPRRDYTVERLDRAVANMEWSDVWRDVGVDIMTCCSSDHLLLLLNFEKKKKKGKFNGKKWRPFRYETGWSKCGDFKKIVQESWAVRFPTKDPWTVFRTKQHGCQRVIKKWVKKQKQPTEKYILEKTTELGKIQEQANPVNVQMEKALKEEINVLMEQEELKWRQRAKENWLRDGDRNTKYFHTCANQRQRRNRIEQVVDRLGRTCTSQATMEQAFIDYYQHLFTSANPHDIDDCTKAIEGRLADATKISLIAAYSEDEVYRALM